MFSETAPTALRDAAPDTLPGATFLRDPVCSMIVTPGPDTPTAEHAGRQFYFCCDGCRTRFEADPAAFIEARDPIDGAPVDRATAEHVARHAGQRFFLSSAENLARFEAAPDEFAPPPAAAGLRHICPMCPEVESQGPDDCPICGMALEPAVPTRETVPSPELLDFQRRLWVAAPLALAVFVLEMGSHL
ncbi:MAG: YHS domain-containing protein, partial [Pseudomonadota bacterium]